VPARPPQRASFHDRHAQVTQAWRFLFASGLGVASVSRVFSSLRLVALGEFYEAPPLHLAHKHAIRQPVPTPSPKFKISSKVKGSKTDRVLDLKHTDSTGNSINRFDASYGDTCFTEKVQSSRLT
jgi:hypothetical protein